ncbi:hypothetical protein [Modestobacter roseus]|uniref:Uncharacterized protein n=1 Tax=Modestobacter roseus TaxID=1181884 RepID=A0A562IVW4_9ACTN|nr:hypothetical protein [Modestobacter roseus]MQA35784.1 hypothetical protein [Modestobacter roseus]TWH75149.1 hypothetical protein JD78_03700 [Modestobacter roseus]
MTDLQSTGEPVPFEEMAAAGRAYVEQLHDEAMHVIADLAEHWDDVVPEPLADVDATAEAVTEDTVTGNAVTGDAVTADDDEDDALAEDVTAAEAEEIRVLLPSELPALPPLPPLQRDARLAAAVTDQFAVPPAEDAALVAAA